MSASLDALAAGWWRLAAPLALAPFLVAGLAAALDRLLARRASPGLRALGWWAVVLELCLPATLLGALVPTALTELARDPAVAALARLGRGAGSSDAIAGLPARVLFAVWLVGALACAAACVWRRRTLARAWLAASAPADAAVRELASASARRLGLVHVPPVRVAASVPGPLLYGLARPTVLLPDALVCSGDPEALELVLLHELAHARRRDPLANLVTLVVQVVFWFHPLAWWTRRRLLALAELAVDRAVVRALGGESLAYRRTLARLVPGSRGSAGRARPGLAFGGSASQVVTRLEALRGPARPDGALARAAALAVPCTALALGALAPPSRIASALSLEQARAVAAVAPGDLRGCLELRHAVLARIALSADERR